MAADIQLGKGLATALTAAAIPGITTVRFSLDPYHESDNLPTNTQIWITTSELIRVLSARRTWYKQCSLLLYMIVPQSPTDTDAIETRLNAFDAIMDLVQSTPINGVLPFEITQDERFDIERLNNDKRLVCVSNINYKLI
jgi:hypothetical protein